MSANRWCRLGDVTKGFFALFATALDREATADPEPARFSRAWDEWQRRHWDRERLRTELREAQALTVTEDDPAPLASEGLSPFLTWSKRQKYQRPPQRARRWAS